jgi:hypothetical protein
LIEISYFKIFITQYLSYFSIFWDSHLIYHLEFSIQKAEIQNPKNVFKEKKGKEILIIFLNKKKKWFSSYLIYYFKI